MTKPWLNLSIVVGLFLMLAPPVLADFQAGLDAYERGDYGTALKEFRPLAEQGVAVAQFTLGGMYDKGHGVPQDYQEAVRWFRLAAEQGYALAQSNLGAMYANGLGVRQNYVQAYMWATLASSQNVELAVKWKDFLVKEMTPAQLAQAQRLAKEWTPKGE